HELPAALAAIEQAARRLGDQLQRAPAVATLTALQRGFDDQPELCAAAGTVLGARHVPLKAAATASGGDACAAVAAAEIATVCCGRCFQMNMARAQHCSGCGAELGLIIESALQGRQCGDCRSPLELIA